MTGQTISHYRVFEKLGGGGMGVVYKAIDLRLDRFVALKFLPPALTRDEDARKRFMQEAKSASALDHPNICTIYEIDETPEGEVFLAMAYYDGETLKRRIEHGAIPVGDALDLAVQILRGLAAAHKSGIVHRDIKPANVMVTHDGVAKIVDFGLAKLVGPSDLTQTGVSVGTVAYMSPEQVCGKSLDAQADLWAVGVTLYEMLSGRLPFSGDGLGAVNAILNASPPPIATLRSDVPLELQRVVALALAKDPGARHPSTAAFLDALIACKHAADGTSRLIAPQTIVARLRSPVVAIPALVVLLAGVAGAGVLVRRASKARWARNEAVPEIQKLILADDLPAAFSIAEEAERYLPGDARLAQIWPQVAADASLVTTPPGADVFTQDYGETSDIWKYLGRTPLKNVRLPRAAVLRFKVQKDGYDTQVLASPNPGTLLGGGGFNVTPVEVPLITKGSAPDMVSIPGGTGPTTLTGFNLVAPVTLDPFLLDRHEITNKEFKPFVDGGGYNGDGLKGMVDSTGRPGPATWELGAYPEGQGDYPVGGVSWYEAVAYCQSRGKSLPTIFHWARAALPLSEVGSALAPTLVPLSNFNKKGVAPVETFRGVGPYGTYDMAGNVREWVWNEDAEGRRWILGGAWNDPDYLFTVGNNLPAIDRSPTNGFRCARYRTATLADRLLARSEPMDRDPRTTKAVSDEVFSVYRSQYALVKSPLNARVESKDTSKADWIREKITLDAGYDGERLSAYLFLPRTATPPYQVAVYFPPLGPSFFRKISSDRFGPSVGPGVYDYVVKSGRALVWPIYKGSFERWDPFLTLSGDEYRRTFRTRMFQWRQDLGRVLDLLAARPDIDIRRLAYLGFSFGSSTAFPLLGLEERLKVAVLLAPGISSIHVGLPPEADPINYASRVRMPVLMVGGRQDYLLPLETSQTPLFARLGTPDADKKHVVYDGGHGQFPRSATIREVLGWLDKYLGPVASRPSS
jgi:eukaryotic-like serine/threonine-protein kinase